MRLSEMAGFAVGVLLAPAAAAGSALRRGRVFHPDGVVCRARVTASTGEGEVSRVGSTLEGPALVRLSGALWRGEKAVYPDILGAAIRFRRDTAASAEPGPDDQDMLFATIPALPLFGVAPFLTMVKTFLWNDYHAIGRFEVEGLGLTKWRLRSPRIPPEDGGRVASLDKAIANGVAIFELQVKEAVPFAKYRTAAHVELEGRVDVDQEALRFSPFRNGRQIVPRGFVNAARIAPYAASQAVRP